MSNDNVFIGFVSKLNSKSGEKNGRKWTAYSARLETKDGEEINQWFRFGFEKPSISKGDYVRITGKEVNDMFVTVGDYKVSSNPPKRSEKPTAATSSGSGSGYNSDEQRADRAYHAARGSAIDLVSVLLEAKALPISAAQGKAGTAKRYEEVVAAVDKLTVKYFRDEFPEFDGNFRLFGIVADEGSISKEVPADVPDREEGVEEDDFDNDINSEDFPEEDDDF